MGFDTLKTKGLFLCLEGPDGCGKTTQLKYLESVLRALGHDVVVAREPGGTKWGQRIRELFFEGQGELHVKAEVMLLLAAKAQVLWEVVYPAYNAGKTVLMDRYSDSLIAYQGHGRRLGDRMIRDLLRASELNFTPDFTIYLDAPWDICRARIAERAAGENNSIDMLAESYHRRVYQGYHEIIRHAEANNLPHAVVDGDRPPAVVANEILTAMQSLVSHTPREIEREYTNVWSPGLAPVALRD